MVDNKIIDEVENKEVEKSAVTKGGLYANLTGSTKGFTIFIIVTSVLLLALMIYLTIK